jgi:hypothetical protein
MMASENNLNPLTVQRNDVHMQEIVDDNAMNDIDPAQVKSEAKSFNTPTKSNSAHGEKNNANVDSAMNDINSAEDDNDNNNTFHSNPHLTIQPPATPSNSTHNNNHQLATPGGTLMSPSSATPSRGGSKWTREEDDLLRAAVEQFEGKNWKRIAQTAFGGSKTDVQCLHRYQKVLKPGLVKGSWTTEEDAQLVKLVEEYGLKHWLLDAHILLLFFSSSSVLSSS